MTVELSWAESVTDKLFGGIDAGGTTFKCAIADATGRLLRKTRIGVTSPIETLHAVCQWFDVELACMSGSLQAMGVASFGPIDIDPTSPDYGTILKTPKPGWSDTPLRNKLAAHFDVPVFVDTDVNGALGAELAWGAAKDCQSAAYMTVGTGIGVGIVSGGQYLGRPYHPEFGHIRISRHKLDLEFEGVCPFHGDCLEGLASATALTKRYGDPILLDDEHDAWRIEAYYLAQACLMLFLTVRVEKVILGGGVMLRPSLIAKVRNSFAELNGDYIPSFDPISCIALPVLGDDAGLMGGVLLAKHG